MRFLLILVVVCSASSFRDSVELYKAQWRNALVKGALYYQSYEKLIETADRLLYLDSLKKAKQ